MSDQFNGAPITACAPLSHSTYTPSPVYSTLRAESTEGGDLDFNSASDETLLAKRYEGPRGKQHQSPTITLPLGAKNNTYRIGRRQDLSGSGFATGTGTEGFAAPSAPDESSASKGTRTTLAYSSIEATNVHTTAFVIAPITGRDIVTSESPSPGPTTHGGNTDTATALPANNGGDDSKPNENGEQGSSSGNDDSSTGGQTNGGASGGGGSSSSGQSGGSENDGSGQDSGHSDNGSHDGDSDGESGGGSTSNSGSDGSGSSEHSHNDAGSHSGGQSTSTDTGSDESSEANDASNNSSGSDDGQGQFGGESSSHKDSSGNGESEGSQQGGGSSQDQSGSATGSSVGNGDPSQVQAAQATFAANGNTYTAMKQGDAVVAEGASATFTVPRGSGTVFDGQTISAASDGNVVALNGQRQTLTVPGASPSYDQTTLTEAGRTFTASQAEETAIVFNEDGSSMTVQGAGQTKFAGEKVSVQPNGNAFVLGSQTISFDAVAPTSPSAVFTAGSHTITALQTGNFMILKASTSTISVSDGAETTFEGQAVSVASNGRSVGFGSQTITLSSMATPASDGQAIFTADDHTITARQSANSVILLDGSSTITIKDGATTRFEGEDLSVASNGGSIIVDGTSTVFLTETPSASSTGIGGYINSGLSPGASATDETQSSPSSTSEFASGSRVLRAKSSFVIAVLGLCGIALM
ncbi:hypothetical protein KC327_g8010 [Hortaea werneckii]|nr:hypothetical protein KC358_g8164 [Hortaea werneckii]KAI6829023.1 hypothetical protein KC350_g7956 [Hortaea werneckii]KAI6933341.1 hypothetical protein KC341_g8351 [Hortaea werneckii]KAI6945713.1 hypothetical protein KC348_g3632 [Hortaea werneckii]KAI6967912.1 hypothetical protein KC321_g8766 [Hortaea werneckii]